MLLLGACDDRPVEVAKATAPFAARSTIRKLVPPPSESFVKSTLIDEDRFYAFAGSWDGANLSIHGTRVVHHTEAPVVADATRRVRGAPALLFEVDDIRTVTWTENSVAYAVDLECAVAGDPRCADDSFLFAQIEALVVAGGGR